ncbi:MAG: sugar phosphate isomerase/epimerase, partial [Candidatus Latescibacterota bacterium]|nr:sugar phosphate isomerase/epimerase [Candidatus Latescibacterota bacterium]
MIKLGANTVLFGGFDLATAMKHIAWAGYDGVELSAIPGMCEHLELDNWKSQVGDIQGLREEYGLDLLAMEATRLDPEWLAKAYEAAAAIGIPVINVGPGGKTGNEDDFQRQTDLLAAEADKAHAHGVMLCVKAHVGA